MLYKVILVDDEYIIRTQIASLVNWEGLGYELAGVFDSGETAVEYLKKNKADLVITDIKMRNVSGIDIARFVSENNLDTMVVFLSGYDDISYAKMGMKYNVKRYISKPVSIMELQEELKELRYLINTNKVKADVFSCYVYTDFFKGALLGENLESSKKLDKTELINNKFCYFTVDILNNTVPENTIKYLYNIFIMLFTGTKFCVLEQEKERFEIISFSKNNLPDSWNELYEKSVCENVGIDINIENIVYAEKFDELEKLFSSLDNNSEKNNKTVENAKKYIDEHISEKLSLKIIAENVYMSIFHLSRTFKKCYGVNISEYILSERLNLAKQYLATSDFPISEIIKMVGFDDNNSYFYQIFKKHVGVTPAEYRKTFRG